MVGSGHNYLRHFLLLQIGGHNSQTRTYHEFKSRAKFRRNVLLIDLYAKPHTQLGPGTGCMGVRLDAVSTLKFKLSSICRQEASDMVQRSDALMAH